MPQSDDLILTGEAARVAGVSQQTLRAWVRAGKIARAGAVPGTGWPLFSRAEVQRVANERSQRQG